MTNGEWQMPNGGWRMGDGKCRDETGQPGFPGARKRAAPSALSADLWAGWGRNAPKRGRKGGFFEVYHVDHIDVTHASA